LLYMEQRRSKIRLKECHVQTVEELHGLSTFTDYLKNKPEIMKGGIPRGTQFDRMVDHLKGFIFNN